MLARIVGIILGLILTTSGYVISGLGALGTWAADWDLGPFEPHRPSAGWAAMTIGGILLVAALIPRKGRSLPGASRAGKRTKGSARGDGRSSAGPAVLDLGGAVAAPVMAQPEPKPEPKPEPAPRPLFVEPAPGIVVTELAAAPAGLSHAAAAPVIAPAPPIAAEPVREPVAEPVAPAPVVEPAVEPVIEPVGLEPAAPPAEPDFAAMRVELLALTAAESWNPAARVLARMVRAARNDRERAIAHRDLGDFAAGQGRHDDAAEAYEEAVSYARSVRQAAPGDPSADELLAGALAGIGDVAESEGRLNEALAAFEESLALRRSPGGREAADPGAQRALSVALERLADLREDRGHRMRALDLYRESYDVTARLAAADPARFGLDLASTRARLAELEAKVLG